MFSDIKRISHSSFFLRPMKRDHCCVFRSLLIQWQWPNKKAVESDFEYRQSIALCNPLSPWSQLGKTLGIVFFAMVAHALGFLLPVGGVCFDVLCILCLRSLCTEATRRWPVMACDGLWWPVMACDGHRFDGGGPFCDVILGWSRGLSDSSTWTATAWTERDLATRCDEKLLDTL